MSCAARSGSPRGERLQDRPCSATDWSKAAAEGERAPPVAVHLPEELARTARADDRSRPPPRARRETRRSPRRTRRPRRAPRARSIVAVSCSSRASPSLPSRVRRKPGGHHLERLAHLVRLDELVLRQRPDDGPAPRPHHHEPFGGQPTDRLAHRAAAHAELGGERRLLQLGAGRQPVGEDLLAQVRVHALPERQVLETASGDLASASWLRRASAIANRPTLGYGRPVECRQSASDPNRGGAIGQPGESGDPPPRDNVRRRDREDSCRCVELERESSPPRRFSRSR